MASDGKHIDTTDERGLHDWARRFDCSPDQLREAVRAVGPDADDVEAHLKGVRSSSNSDRVSREL